MVEGAGTVRNDRVRRSVQIIQDTLRRDVNDAEPVFRNECVSHSIPHRPISAIMAFAVNFDHRLHRGTIVIDDVRTDGMLAAEFETGVFAAQSLPQQRLGQAQIAPQSARDCDLGAKRARPAPSTLR